MPLLLLTSTGARSGQPRLSPTCLHHGRRPLRRGRQRGEPPTHPDWYHNIAANPDVTVEVGAEKFSARADIAAEPERTRLFNVAVEVYPQLGDHERNSGGLSRLLPLLACERSINGEKSHNQHSEWSL